MILAALAFVLFTLGMAAYRFSQMIGIQQKLNDITTQLHEERAERKRLEGLALRAETAMSHISHFARDLRDLRESSGDGDLGQHLTQLLHTVIESLASDIKHVTGDSHRVGLWVEWNGSLVLAVPSTGFPLTYTWSRSLDINDSTAGRAFRKAKEEVVPDVDKDQDYKWNPESRHSYRALICIPITYNRRVSGVVTIDGKKPFTEEDLEVARAYARLTEAIFGEYVDCLVRAVSTASSESESGEGDPHDQG